MNTPERTARLRQLHSTVRVSSQRVRRMEVQLEEPIQSRGIEVDNALHQNLSAIMAESSVTVHEHPPGSFPCIFGEQWERASKLKNAKSMRWEPAMIRLVFCCYQ